MKGILISALFSFAAAAAAATSSGHVATSADPGVTARVRSDISLRMAAIRSLGDVHNYVAIHRSRLTPLDALSPGNRRVFLDSLTFNNNGITGFSYAPLQGLTPSQAYKILSLFGVERLTQHVPGLSPSSDTDKMIMSPLNTTGPGMDHEGYACQSRGTCAPKMSYICTSNC